MTWAGWARQAFRTIGLTGLWVGLLGVQGFFPGLGATPLVQDRQETQGLGFRV